MDTGWIAYNAETRQLLHLSHYDGWQVDTVMFKEEDLFGFLPGKIEPIEDEI